MAIFHVYKYTHTYGVIISTNKKRLELNSFQCFFGYIHKDIRQRVFAYINAFDQVSKFVFITIHLYTILYFEIHYFYIKTSGFL